MFARLEQRTWNNVNNVKKYLDKSVTVRVVQRVYLYTRIYI